MSPFNLACFCILMDHHRQGPEQAHPNYLAQKFDDFARADEATAYAMLDSSNQERADTWRDTWQWQSTQKS